MIITGIYKITSPSNKVYIGQSVDLALRVRKYKRLNCKGQPKLYASLLKYGFESHKFEILQLCSVDELNQLEKYYVDLFESFNSAAGMNLKDGGGSKGRLSEISKAKMMSKLKGKKGNRKGTKHSTESRIKMSISHKAKHRIPWNKGIKNYLSKDIKIKMSNRAKNNKYAPRTPICQYSKDYEIIQKYESVAEASRISKVTRTGIINNLKKRTKTSGGFIWEYSKIIA